MELARSSGATDRRTGRSIGGTINRSFNQHRSLHHYYKKKKLTSTMAPSKSTSNFSSPYATAANILNQIFTKRKGLKTIAYSRDGELTCSKATYAQCSHVLEQKTLLDKLAKELQQKSKMEVANQGLLYVLLYELLLGPNKSIRGGGAVKRQLMNHEDTLKSALKRLQKENNTNRSSKSSSNKNTVIIPRYVRINTLVAGRDSVLKEIKDRLGGTPIYSDAHVPDIIVVEPTAKNRELLQDLVTSHKIILQDKSSCFSALCLMHGFDGSHQADEGDYLDACAAPGNKTSHLAALIHDQMEETNKGSQTPTVHAFDKAPDRYKLLKRRMVELCPNDSVRCYNLDFLDINSPKNKFPEKDNNFENLRAILLDPSCSGSGMTTNHTEHSSNRDPFFKNDRIQSLSDFQFQALRHATTNFPLVNRVVYSTCSCYYSENEGVVQRVLGATDGKWELVAPKCLESWPRRGLMSSGDDSEDHNGLTEEQIKCLIRVDPDHDATNGFFVACFQRVKSNDSKKKRKKSRASPSWISPAEACSADMELYNNQFHVENKNSKSPENESKSKKRKQPSEEGSHQTSTAATSALSKKRAKKLEWKKHQRLKKESRLKRKQAVEKE
jgi:putative methyltransferase